MQIRRQADMARRLLACSTVPQSLILIGSDKQFDTWLSIVTHNREVADFVKMFHIALSCSAPPVTMFQRLLSSTANLTDLLLFLPPSIPVSACERILSTLYFPQLVLFNTSFPHISLISFLQRHERISYLSVGRCRSARKCPLGGLYMPSLSEVRGPTSCISTLINNSPITHASIHHECSADVDLPLPRVLRAISTSSAPLCVLQMDFDPTDYDIVAQIAVAAPGLNALKLIEKGRKVSARPTHLRRAWNYSEGWARQLASLPLLKNFALRTATSLICRMGNIDDEQRLITAWTSPRNVPGAFTPAPKFHPSLDHLTVWYIYTDCGVDGAETGVLSCWNGCRGMDGTRLWVRTYNSTSPSLEMFY